MQIAKQIYGIYTAENALIFFKDGSPAYITKRFDVKKEGGKWGKEDFATLSGKTNVNAGVYFKYSSSFALDKGLFLDDFKSDNYKKFQHPSKYDFIEFGKRIGVQKNRIEKLLNPFLVRQAFVETLIARSFLSEANKREYLLMNNRKRTFLNN